MTIVFSVLEAVWLFVMESDLELESRALKWDYWKVSKVIFVMPVC